MRRELEQRFDMHAIDMYGLSEVIGPGVAAECVEAKDGPHVWEDHFYPEVIDPATGEVLLDGERGELVLTSLTKEAMPVIRFRTRDVTRLLPGTARTMCRMERVSGRTDDMIILRGVDLFPTQIEELIVRTPDLSPHYQLVLARPHRLDEMTVRVEARPQTAGSEERADAGKRLAKLVKDSIGLTVAVARRPRLLERPGGGVRQGAADHGRADERAGELLAWLERRGLEADADTVERILAAAKASNHVLRDEEILALLPSLARA